MTILVLRSSSAAMRQAATPPLRLVNFTSTGPLFPWVFIYTPHLKSSQEWPRLPFWQQYKVQSYHHDFTYSHPMCLPITECQQCLNNLSLQQDEDQFHDVYW